MESETVKTCELEMPARIQTAIQFPAVLLDLKARDAVVFVAASMLVCCTKAILPIAIGDKHRKIHRTTKDWTARARTRRLENQRQGRKRQRCIVSRFWSTSLSTGEVRPIRLVSSVLNSRVTLHGNCILRIYDDLLNLHDNNHCLGARTLHSTGMGWY